MVGEPQVFGRPVDQRRHFRAARAIEHFEHRDRRDDAVVIAAADGRIEEIMAAFSKPASAPSSAVRRLM
jgi:hypothetical protein